MSDIRVETAITGRPKHLSLVTHDNQFGIVKDLFVNKPRLFFRLALLCALAGCAGKPRLEPGPGLRVADSTELPSPTRSDYDVREREYLIGAFDKLTIGVFGVEELSGKVQADASGRIAVPLIGVLSAAGRTPAELADEIASKLRGRFVRNPQVTVNLDETVSQVVTVDGEVKKPGLYPVVGRMTLVKAVATAEGATEYSRLNAVVVFRTVQGQRYAALYDLSAIRKGLYADPEVFANDVVVVGESRARRIFRDVLSATPAVLTPLILLLR